MPSTPTARNAPLRVGFLGTGVIAVPHAIALRAIPGVQLAAVCDLDRAKATAFQTQWQVPQVFDSLDAMLAAVDVVHVLLPPSVHAEQAITCLRAQRHVFVEKPLALSARECERIGTAAEEAGCMVGVNHNLTYMPGMLKLIEAIKDYRLGAVEHVTAVYNMPMPALAAGQHGHWMFGETERLILELCPHPMSVICRLLGGVQEAATTVSGRTQLRNGKTFFDTWQSSLVCDRGTAQLFLGVGRDYLNTWVHVVGQDGEAFVDLRRNTVRISEKTKYLRSDNLVDGWRNGTGLIKTGLTNFVRYAQGALGLAPAFELQNESMKASIGAFYGALLGNRPVPVGLEEGSAVVRGCEAILCGAPELKGVR